MGFTGPILDEQAGIPGFLRKAVSPGFLQALMGATADSDADAIPATPDGPRLKDRVSDDPETRKNVEPLSQGNSAQPSGTWDERLPNGNPAILPGGIRTPSRMPQAVPQTATGVPPGTFGSPGMPQVGGAAPAPTYGQSPQGRQSLVDEMRQRYEQLNTPPPPMTGKQKLLQMVLRAAPLIAGGIAGKGYGLTGAAQGEEAGIQREQNLELAREHERQGESGRLLQEMGAYDRMQESEDAATQRERYQQEAQTEREKAAAEAQGRGFAQQSELEREREAARDAQQKETEKAASDRQQAQFRESEDRQNRQFGEQEKLANQREDRADARAKNSASLKDEVAVQKTVDAARNIDRLDNEQKQILSEVEKSGKKGMFGGGPYLNGPQSMQFLANHLALTIGTVKGARTGRDMIEAHIKARDMDQGMEAIAQRVLSGGVITHDQARQMLATTEVKRKGAWDQAQATARDHNVDISNKLPAEYGGGSQGAQPGAVQNWVRDASGKLVKQ